MPLEIERTQDRVKVSLNTIELLIKEHVAAETGRHVDEIQFHVGRGDLYSATATLTFKD